MQCLFFAVIMAVTFILALIPISAAMLSSMISRDEERLAKTHRVSWNS